MAVRIADRRGLGRGLGELFQRTEPAIVVERDSTAEPHTQTDPASPASAGTSTPIPDGSYFAEISLEAITPNPRQPRTNFDEEAMAELVDGDVVTDRRDDILQDLARRLVKQNIVGDDGRDARRLGWHGMQLGVAIAAAMGAAAYLAREPLLAIYTRDRAVIAVALPLLAWVMLFHVGDAAQVIAANVLRAYHLATLPMLIYVAALWGVGIGGGYLLAFDATGYTPDALRGTPGYWAAFTLGISIAAALLCVLLAWVLVVRRREERAARSGVQAGGDAVPG